MIMSGFSQLLGPASATASESLPSPDTTDQSEQDFAALLAAAFAPVTAPNTPELLTGSALPETQAASSLALASGQPSDFRQLWPLTLQTDLMGNPSAFPLTISTEASGAVMPLTNVDGANPEVLTADVIKADVINAELVKANSMPANASPAAPFLPLGSKIANLQLTATEQREPGSGFSVGESTRSSELPGRAARVVKDIVAEPEAIEPTGQVSEAGSKPEGAPEPSLSEQPEPLPIEDNNSAQATTSLQANSVANSATPATSASSSPAQSIANQTIHPIIELAQQTPHRETRSLRFNLHPEELGRVEVEVTRDAAGRVSASLNADHLDAANALTHSIGHLREALEKAGVKVDHLEVFTTSQFQQNPNGQTNEQHAQRATQSGALLLDQVTEDGTATVEEEKLLNLRA